jgi:hypothetical protein
VGFSVTSVLLPRGKDDTRKTPVVCVSRLVVELVQCGWEDMTRLQSVKWVREGEVGA